MNWKANAPVRGQKLRLKPPCSTMAVTVTAKFLQPNPALLFSRLWRCASENPKKCFHTRAQLHPKICRSNRLFPPIFPDSIERVCGKRECFDRRFDDGIAAQRVTVTAADIRRNPIYVLIPLAFPKSPLQNFNNSTRNPLK